MTFDLRGTGQLVKAAGVIAKLIAKERKSTTMFVSLDISTYVKLSINS